MGIPHESMFPGPGELSVEYRLGYFFLKKNPGHVQALKSQNKDFFDLWNYF
jgi:hypothetical protein